MRAILPAPEVQRHTEEYTVCGCGCCGGAGGPAAREKTVCVSAAKLAELEVQDEAARDNPQCAVMGCSLGTRYAVCE